MLFLIQVTPRILLVFYFKEKKNVMFVGDFIFLDSIGRCDLEGGSFKEMKQSIEKIKKFSDDIILYPGHGSKTMLGYEKMHNPFFQIKIVTVIDYK